MFSVDLNGWKNFPGGQISGGLRNNKEEKLPYGRFFELMCLRGTAQNEVTRHFVSPRGTSFESPAPEDGSSGHLSFLKLKG